MFDYKRSLEMFETRTTSNEQQSGWQALKKRFDKSFVEIK